MPDQPSEPDSFRHLVKSRLRQVRAASNLSARELASVASVSPATWSAWESPEQPNLPTLSGLHAIARHLQLSIDYFLRDEHEAAVFYVDRAAVDRRRRSRDPASRVWETPFVAEVTEAQYVLRSREDVESLERELKELHDELRGGRRGN